MKGSSVLLEVKTYIEDYHQNGHEAVDTTIIKLTLKLSITINQNYTVTKVSRS